MLFRSIHIYTHTLVYMYNNTVYTPLQCPTQHANYISQKRSLPSGRRNTIIGECIAICRCNLDVARIDGEPRRRGTPHLQIYFPSDHTYTCYTPRAFTQYPLVIPTNLPLQYIPNPALSTTSSPPPAQPFLSTTSAPLV